MSSILLPEPNPEIIARRDAIIADLISIVGAEAVVSDEDGRGLAHT